MIEEDGAGGEATSTERAEAGVTTTEKGEVAVDTTEADGAATTTAAVAEEVAVAETFMIVEEDIAVDSTVADSVAVEAEGENLAGEWLILSRHDAISESCRAVSSNLEYLQTSMPVLQINRRMTSSFHCARCP